MLGVSPDDDFPFFRRFDKVNARLALKLQGEISVLEERLETADQKYGAELLGPPARGGIAIHRTRQERAASDHTQFTLAENTALFWEEREGVPSYDLEYVAYYSAKRMNAFA
ncbi:hypothetical protein DL768_007775 [Monosporascus sp. mg162]|nr:hypothetical protein DL768_007775 [Monosporascus sp. mg162]